MLKLCKWAYQSARETGKTAFLKYRAYTIHGVFLPRGSMILKPENVVIGKDFLISPNCLLFCQDPSTGSRLEIGDRVALNYGVYINADSGGKIFIDDNVIMGPGCVIRAADHLFDDRETPIRDQGKKPGVIRIEEDVWLGGGVTVLKDVTIGRSSVVGAGSVVTRDIPPFTVAAGNPARVIKTREG